MMVAQENKEYVEKNSTQSKDENKSLPTSSMKSKISNFVKNITIEPAMFIMVLSMTMSETLFQQFVMTKICLVDLGYNDTVCDDENLVTEFPEANEEVQIEFVNFMFYLMLVYTIIPTIFSFYLGAWCDIYGRKFLIKLFLFAEIFSRGNMIVNAYFMDLKKEFLFIGVIPYGIVGGMSVFFLAIYAFMADITTPENRGFRFAMLGVTMTIAGPIAPILGAFIYSKIGYFGLFSVALGGILFGGFLLLFSMRSYEWTPKQNKDENNRNAFSIKHPIDCVKSIFKKREGPNRKYILIFLTIISMWHILLQGEGTMHQPYVRSKFEWYYPQISQYQSITNFVGIGAQLIFVPLIKLTGISESLVMVILMALSASKHFVQGLAEEPWMYYLGAILDSLGPYNGQIISAMNINCVSEDEIGKISAARHAIETVLPIPFQQLYIKIWEETSNFFPGAVFLLSGGAAVIATILSGYIFFSLKGKSFSEVTAKGAGRIKENEENSFQVADKGKIFGFKISSL